MNISEKLNFMHSFEKVLKDDNNVIKKLQTDISQKIDDNKRQLNLIKLISLKKSRKVSEEVHIETAVSTTQNLNVSRLSSRSRSSQKEPTQVSQTVSFWLLFIISDILCMYKIQFSYKILWFRFTKILYRRTMSQCLTIEKICCTQLRGV